MELANNEINKIIQDLLLINQTLETNERERKKTELYDSNRFNPFQFIRTDEMGLSKIIAFLLDPKERHGQGDLFLNSFLKYINKPSFLAYDNAQVVVEKLTSKNRRHDIFIEGYLNDSRNWIISIENKLKFASDQIEQLKDYQKDIEENYSQGDYCLVYLPVFKEEPSEESIPRNEWNKLVDEGKAVLLSAEDLILWLDDTPMIAPAIKQFCDGFKRYLNEDLMANKEENNQLVKYLLESDNELYSALSVIDSTKQLHDELMKILIGQLQNRFSNYSSKLINYGWKCRCAGDIYSNLFGIFIDRDDECWGIGIEFDRANFTDGYYGVYCHKKENLELYNLLEDIFDKSGFKTSFNSTRWWSLWKWFDSNMLSWNADILRKIPNGELSNYIFDLWKPLLDVIEDNLDKIENLKNNSLKISQAS